MGEKLKRDWEGVNMHAEVEAAIDDAVLEYPAKAAATLEEMRNHLSRRNDLIQGQNELSRKKDELKEVQTAMAAVRKIATQENIH